MQLGFGYWGSKTLLSAVELGLFTALATGPHDAEALIQRLGLHPRRGAGLLRCPRGLGHGAARRDALQEYARDRPIP
jgi:hypothetical protein